MLTFNLAKLSHTADLPISHAVDGPDWTHIHNTGSLVAVLDTFRSGGTPSVFLRIENASRTLYDVPIEEMIRAGEQLQRSRLDPTRAEDLPVYCIYRPPFLLALRWLSDDQKSARRIQMRFIVEQDYETAFDNLRQLGLHMTPARTAAKLQGGSTTFPPASSTTNNRPSTAAGSATSPLRVQLQEAAARPSSTMSSNAHPLHPPVYFPRPDSAMSETMNNRFAELQSTTGDVYATPTRPLSATFARPSSSELPPRRELPFPRPDTPKSGGSDGTRPGSRPSSGLMLPPQLPTPRAEHQRPTSKAGSSSVTGLPPLAKPTPLSKVQIAPQVEAASSRRVPSRGNSGTLHPQSAFVTTKENHLSTQFPSLLRLASRDGMAHQRAPLNAMSETAQNERFHQPSYAPATPLSSDFDHQTTSAALAELSVYAKQSDEVRMDTINTFLLQHLESDDFRTLVDDMEAAWARIGPGFG